VPCAVENENYSPADHAGYVVRKFTQAEVDSLVEQKLRAGCRAAARHSAIAPATAAATVDEERVELRLQKPDSIGDIEQPTEPGAR